MGFCASLYGCLVVDKYPDGIGAGIHLYPVSGKYCYLKDVTQARSGGPPDPITGFCGGQPDAERQQLVGALCLRSLEGPRASNATSQSVLGRNRKLRGL